MTFYDRALTGDADTFATRVLAIELTPAHQRIHVETLLCLLRDAYQQRNPAAVSFIRPFLNGLLSASVIVAHEQNFSGALLGALAPAPVAAPPPAPSGGLKVMADKPLPRKPSPAQSASLSW